MIEKRTAERLGNAIAELHRDYSEEDLAIILQYAYKHHSLKNHPKDVAELLEDLAAKLQKLARKQGIFVVKKLPKKKHNGS